MTLQSMEKRIGLGLLGCGGVGTAFVELVHRQGELYRKRHGIDLQLVRIAVRDLNKKRGDLIPRELLTDSVTAVVDHPEVDTVVEVIGGTGVAYEAVKRALNHGKNVVTANKAMLAEHGPELMDLAHQNGVQLRFEAAVGGGVPIIGALMSGLAANNFHSVTAIVNGTTNYILTRMSLDGMSFEEALRLAQVNGFAEPDPTFDITGRDAAQKLAIIAALAFGVDAKESSIPTEGVERITAEDIRAARRFDYRLRLLAVARRHGEAIELRVQPALLPNGHFLAGIEDEFNAFLIDGDATGEIFLVGRGAGPLPSAGAVLADVMDVTLRTVGEKAIANYTWEWGQMHLQAPGEVESGYYMRFPVLNEPGIIGTISTILGQHRINIDSASARQAADEPELGIVEILSQRALERDVRQAFAVLATQTNVLKGTPRFLRIEVWRPEGGYL